MGWKIPENNEDTTCSLQLQVHWRRLAVAIFLFVFSSIYSQSNIQLNYSLTNFNSDTCCWRKLSKEDKYAEAAELIVDYIKFNRPKNKHALNWHAGQLFASAGNTKLAVKYIRKTYNGFYNTFGDEDAKTWYLYAKGVECFLLRKRDQLKKIIAKWEKKFRKDLNYQQLIMLDENWNLSYEKAVK